MKSHNLNHPSFLYILLDKWETNVAKHVQAYIDIQYIRQLSLYNSNEHENQYLIFDYIFSSSRISQANVFQENRIVREINEVDTGRRAH